MEVPGVSPDVWISWTGPWGLLGVVLVGLALSTLRVANDQAERTR